MAEALKKSGETPKAFGVRHGIAADRVNWWLRRLARTPTATQRSAGQVPFAPVKVLASKAVKPAAPAVGSSLEVVLRGGRAVRVGPEFDPAHLRRVIAAIEGEARC